MLKTQNSEINAQRSDNPALIRVRKNVYRQALLAGLTIVLTVVILFAITAAWYTNIVQSSGLKVEASAWGFNGKVTVDEDPIQAAPGDEGIIELTAESNSNELTAVSLNVSKAMMTPEEMQQRLYFYVDTTKSQNGEIMDRVYLNNQNSYTYTIFSQGTLTLTEAVHNGPLLKWHWVYDVLGYYVQGTWDDTTKTVTVSEYLRPIEYDYDEAATTFTKVENKEDGTVEYTTLETIDGTTTVAQFLEQISKNDGYAGTINAEAQLNGYYPVAIDENGAGVWAYLCTYSEIVRNTKYDTKLGLDAAGLTVETLEGTTGDATTEAAAQTYVAKLTITAQNSNAEFTEISTASGLLETLSKAKEAGESALVRLTDNLVLDAPLTLTQGQAVMLDLNGNTLQVPSGEYQDKTAGIQASEGSALTMINGTLEGTGNGFALYSTGAEITLSEVTITDVDCALYVRDEANASEVDSTIRLVGCTLDTSHEAIYLSGNGSDSERETRLVVEDSTIRSGYIGITGNGNASNGGQWGTDIQIMHSTVDGLWAGVYQPQQNSTLTISKGSVITGYTGLALKGGTAVVLDSTVQGTGEAQIPDAFSVSGFNDTGDAVYIETNYNYEISLQVRGNSKLTSAHNQALRIFQEGADNVSVVLYSGIFSSDVTAYISGGTECTWTESGYVVSAVATENATTEEAATEEAVADETTVE